MLGGWGLRVLGREAGLGAGNRWLLAESLMADNQGVGLQENLPDMAPKQPKQAVFL